MIICRSVAEVRAARAGLAPPVGFVPTMGALHAGHESLVARACGECASVIASVYVNPLQFGPQEDFANYPRAFDADAALLEKLGTTVLFGPGDGEMYPAGRECTVDPGDLGVRLEGQRRPGHFRGVATVVLKLLNMTQPNRAYFGRKDAQQLAIVARMIADFNLPVEIVACATVRERDGLAISSRNRYLSQTERHDAAGLSRALKFIVQTLEGGASDVGAVMRAATAELGELRKDYLEVVDPNEFTPLSAVSRGSQLLAVGAVFAGTTRLIDNMELQTPQ